MRTSGRVIRQNEDQYCSCPQSIASALIHRVCQHLTGIGSDRGGYRRSQDNRSLFDQ